MPIWAGEPSCTQSGTQLPPAGQSPSTAQPDAGSFVQAKPQPFGFVARPGRPQLVFAPGQAEAVEQMPPSLLPPMQRSPPQTPPPGQSALLAHGPFGCVPPAHVSQAQVLNCVKPVAVQGRVAVFSLNPVVVGRKRMSRPPPEMLAPLSGGQSRDTGPKVLRPWTVHVWPAAAPPVHVPVLPTLSVLQSGVVQQRAHGASTAVARWTRASRNVKLSFEPVLTSIVPVIGRGKKLVTQTGTPPEESGSGAPRKPPQRPFNGAQSASVTQCWRAFSSQRQPYFPGRGPVSRHAVSVTPSQSNSRASKSVLPTVCVFCDVPVQP